MVASFVYFVSAISLASFMHVFWNDYRRSDLSFIYVLLLAIIHR